MIYVWRLVPERHAGTAFTGEGAKSYGGRWNKIGLPAVYTSEHLSLAVLEQFIHLNSDEITDSYVYLKAAIPEELEISEIPVGTLPAGWDDDVVRNITVERGSAWLENKLAAALKVPSVIVSVEHNYILNPLHPDYHKIKIGPAVPFNYDKRMSKE